MSDAEADARRAGWDHAMDAAAELCDAQVHRVSPRELARKIRALKRPQPVWHAPDAGDVDA
jgi:hypothetical protein